MPAIACSRGEGHTHRIKITSQTYLTNDPINNSQRVVVSQTATGFKQGIAALGGFFKDGGVAQ